MTLNENNISTIGDSVTIYKIWHYKGDVGSAVHKIKSYHTDRSDVRYHKLVGKCIWTVRESYGTRNLYIAVLEK